MAAKTKKKALPRKKATAKKPKAKKKKKNVVLFIPKPEDQERRKVGLDARRRVLAWACAGRTAGRSASTPIRVVPPLAVDWKKKLKAGCVAAPVVSEDGI